jgi:hypothetical protein
MKALAHIDHGTREVVESRSFAIDTTFVLFFLAVELGQSESILSLDTALVGVTLLMVMALPYFVNSDENRPAFKDWFLGRVFISLFAIVLGVMFRQALGTVLPETLRFLPMTLLILTAMISCYVQFYGFLKFRLAK